MFVILAYDVKGNRDNKVRKQVLKYLFPVQESVFEGYISMKNLSKLKTALKNILDVEYDYIKFYCLDSVSYVRQDELGIVKFPTKYIL